MESGGEGEDGERRRGRGWRGEERERMGGRGGEREDGRRRCFLPAEFRGRVPPVSWRGRSAAAGEGVQLAAAAVACSSTSTPPTP